MAGRSMEADLALGRSRIEAAARITVLSHARPDGDAVGTMLGLAWSLREKGKTVVSVLKDGVPHRFKFMPGAEAVDQEMPPEPGLIIVVDSSDLERTGFEPAAFHHVPDINIDHHTTNTMFAALNLVDPQAASASELLYELAPGLDLPVTSVVARCWLMALITDTLGFRTPSVSPRTMRIAADLMEAGAKMPELYLRGLQQHRFVDLQYWAQGLGRLERRGIFAWTSLSLEDRARVGFPDNDDADLTNLVSAIEGVYVSMIFVEQDSDRVKVSWRSQEGYDVSSIAASLGGGGHAQAAGAMIMGSLAEVVELVVGETEKVLSPRPE
ncbi:MAG: bifunctional oligoribonuclease/PAP phosphatase NrnA [Anaerolineales bacterium]|nr:bifunctional oligoribonuclease/PAP phosphatase NrnA [Anaerolineales bacterium]